MTLPKGGLRGGQRVPIRSEDRTTVLDEIKEVAHSQSLHPWKVVATLIKPRAVAKTCKKKACAGEATCWEM